MSCRTTLYFFTTFPKPSSLLALPEVRPQAAPPGAAPIALRGNSGVEAWRISLAEALAKQGGLSDALADPASVFLYRGETREVAQQIGVNVNDFQGSIIPIIYSINLRDPSGYFLAQTFEMRNKDVIYTSNAQAVETTKFLTFVRTIMATANDPIIYATNGFALKAAIEGTQTTTVITTPTPIATVR